MRDLQGNPLASLPPDVQFEIRRRYGRAAHQLTILDQEYWSSVQFLSTRAAGPPVALTIDNSVRQAFSYGIGQAMNAAGFAAGTNATAAETNLNQGNQTRDNSDFIFWGISAAIQPDSEPMLAARVWRETAVSISVNGKTTIPIGTLDRFPSAGGLYGSAISSLRVPPLDTAGGGLAENGSGVPVSFLSNGNPMSGSFRRLLQCYFWSGIGRGGSDSSLTINMQPQRAIVESAAVARAAAAGILAFTPPAAAGDRGTFVTVKLTLHGVEISQRSQNV